MEVAFIPRPMRAIGFQHNYSLHTDLTQRFSPSLINRVALIERSLRPEGFRLFLYNPTEVDLEDARVQGLVLGEQGKFEPHAEPIPAVNGNWTHRTRRLLDQGVGYQEFVRWTQARGVGTYVPHALSELLGNKLETYKLVRGFHENLHPHCESYRNTQNQLQHFVESGPLTFLKPRTGSKGEGILTLRRGGDGLTLTRYEKGARREQPLANLAEARSALAEATIDGETTYIIQHGVETLRYEDATFDIRVTMLHDGRRWHWLHEARLSRGGSDVSNVSQGGAILPTEHLLFELLGTEASQEMLYHLQSEAFGLAQFLETLHPGEVLELAFDFVIDSEGQLRLLEINTKPGLAGIGSNISVFDKGPEDEEAFERWVYPHTRYLAEFLMTRARERAG